MQDSDQGPGRDAPPGAEARPMRQDCYGCGGEGHCADCRDEGLMARAACTTCDGTGTCTRCGGSGADPGDAALLGDG